MLTYGINLDLRNLGDIYDDSRYHHTISNTGCTIVRGVHGLALYFNGKTSSLIISAHSALQYYKAKSVFAWAEPSVSTAINRTIYDASNDAIVCQGGSDDVVITLTNDVGTSVNQTISYTPSQWFYIGYTWDGTTVTYYLNGISVGTDALSGTLPCTTDVHVGLNIGFVELFDSIISTLSIWNYSLSVDDVKLHYRTQSPYYRQEVAPTVIL